VKYEEILGELGGFRDVFSTEEWSNAVRIISDMRQFPEQRIIGLGAGRMGYSLRAFIMRLNHLGLSATMIGDTGVPPCGPRALCIINSSSGATPSMVLYARQALAAGAYIMLFTSRDASELTQLSHLTVCYGQTPSRQMMKTVYEQFSFLMFDKLASDIRDRLNISDYQLSQSHSNLE